MPPLLVARRVPAEVAAATVYHAPTVTAGWHEWRAADPLPALPLKAAR